MRIKITTFYIGLLVLSFPSYPTSFLTSDCFFLYSQCCSLLGCFTSSFPIWILFISFSALIAVSNTYKTMLNGSGKSGHSFLVPDFRGNAFNFSPLRVMLAVGLSYRAFIMLRYVPSIPAFWRVLITNECWILSKAFSASIEIIIWFLSFNLLMWLTQILYH